MAGNESIAVWKSAVLGGREKGTLRLLPGPQWTEVAWRPDSHTCVPQKGREKKTTLLPLHLTWILLYFRSTQGSGKKILDLPRDLS